MTQPANNIVTAQNAPAPEPEVVIATATRVGCDGGAGLSQGALGHPLVYVTLKADPATGRFSGECGYCDRRFVLVAGVETHGH